MESGAGRTPWEVLTVDNAALAAAWLNIGLI
jgi:hypothetical protein